jgi:hypothetical protein
MQRVKRIRYTPESPALINDGTKPDEILDYLSKEFLRDQERRRKAGGIK